MRRSVPSVPPGTRPGDPHPGRFPRVRRPRGSWSRGRIVPRARCGTPAAPRRAARGSQAHTPGPTTVRRGPGRTPLLPRDGHEAGATRPGSRSHKSRPECFAQLLGAPEHPVHEAPVVAISVVRSRQGLAADRDQPEHVASLGTQDDVKPPHVEQPVGESPARRRADRKRHTELTCPENRMPVPEYQWEPRFTCWHRSRLMHDRVLNLDRPRLTCRNRSRSLKKTEFIPGRGGRRRC